MPTYLTAILASVLTVQTMLSEPVPHLGEYEIRANEGFSILLSTSGEDLRATCESGCRWDSVTALYPGSTYRIDVAGVHPVSPVSSVSPPESTTSGFLFTVRASAGRISATCEKGCSWQTVQGASENGVYRIDVDGIEIR
jgi:hypothetical protein